MTDRASSQGAEEIESVTVVMDGDNDSVCQSLCVSGVHVAEEICVRAVF